ncbi:MAG: polymerase subfamily sigma factor [Thermoleophilia bacterium]|nr:polymerase subfamily sigma factor [Thermoleophilia bacterium]MCZ4496186.1 polymerase subfamily sigma factor [Thermoleophilia bacterium]
MTAETDHELVRRAKAGDERAFTALVERHQDRVYSVARGVVRSPEDAADVAQETFIAVLRHLATFQESAAFTTWLHRITLRKAYDHLRRRVPEPVDPASVAVEHLAGRDADPQSTGLGQRALLDAIAALDPPFRDAILLVDVAGLGVQEAADALGIAGGTVKSRVFRGRAALARTLGTQGYGRTSEE